MTGDELRAWRHTVPRGSVRKFKKRPPAWATQREVAEMLQVPLASYKQWEAGRRRVPVAIERLTQLVDEYELEPD